MPLLMEWKSYVRKIGGSLYISLPADYVKARKIDRDDLLTFSLNVDGSLTIIPENWEAQNGKH